MSIKLLALDMDGTLLNSAKEAPKDFVPWVKSHPEINTVISSGRQYYKLKSQFIEIADNVIFLCENGAIVYENDNPFYINNMTSEEALAVLKQLLVIDNAVPIVCGMKSAYICTRDEAVLSEASKYYDKLKVTEDNEELFELTQNDKVLKLALFVKEKRAEEFYNRLSLSGEQTSNIAQVLSGDSWIDYALKSVNKGSAIVAVQEKLGIDPEDCMAFGDYLNDREMLLNCKRSRAMKNAHPDIIKIAEEVTDYTNDEDGVMKALKKAGL